eukprot:scaffold144624_cov18-Prasinocladus_malaysianus.AAC.1
MLLDVGLGLACIDTCPACVLMRPGKISRGRHDDRFGWYGQRHVHLSGRVEPSHLLGPAGVMLPELW